MSEDERVNELLIAGAKSYPKALAAVAEFRRLVHNLVRDAVRVELSTVAASMGIRLSPSEIKLRARPAELGSSEIDGENARLGVVIRREAEGWNQYYQFSWEPKSFYFTASVWFTERAHAIAISKALHQVHPKSPVEVDLEDGEIYMTLRLGPDEITQCSHSLREFLKEWAELWKNLGGLNRFMEKI